MSNEFSIHYARGLWGLANQDPAVDCAQVAEDGFDWVEAYWDGSAGRLPGIVEQNGLKWIAQIHTRKAWANQGAERLTRMVESAVEGHAQLINLHTGSDLQSPEENLAPIDLAAELSEKHGIPIVHETHRGRATWNLPTTEQLIQLRPDLHFCADLSHWTCVHESLLQEQDERLDATLSRSLLVHARVGYTQGPQVPHWNTEAFAPELERFLGLWDRAVAFAKAQQRPLVLCPEFGPFPYQAIDPKTGAALADNREVNRSMGELLRTRYA